MKLSDLENEYAPRAATPRLAEAAKRQRERAEALARLGRQDHERWLAEQAALSMDRLADAAESLANALDGRVRKGKRRG